MSAQEQMRAMLDQLMGTQRDGNEEHENQIHFNDAVVCKSFLLGGYPLVLPKARTFSAS